MNISNIHSHIVPYVDDGAKDMLTAFKMIDMEYDQGTRLLICSSHNGYSKSYIDNYLQWFQQLNHLISIRYPDMILLPANEVYCTKEDIDEIIHLLASGEILPINNTKYVLTEFSPFITLENAKYILHRLLNEGWIPVIAHFERYYFLYNEDFLEDIIQKGALIQCNLYSFAEESSEEIKTRARMLLENKYIHFVGSDCHSDTKRKPSLAIGINFIINNSSAKYANAVIYENAVTLLSNT